MEDERGERREKRRSFGYCQLEMFARRLRKRSSLGHGARFSGACKEQEISGRIGKKGMERGRRKGGRKGPISLLRV